MIETSYVRLSDVEFSIYFFHIVGPLSYLCLVWTSIAWLFLFSSRNACKVAELQKSILSFNQTFRSKNILTDYCIISF